MMHKERAILALEGGQPDYVPTFELAFQLTEEAFGRRFHEGAGNNALPEAERLELCRQNADLYLAIARRYEHSIIMICSTPSSVYPQRYMELVYTAQCVRRMAQSVGEDYLLITHGDATFSIPEGEWLEEMVEWLAETPERLDVKAEHMMYTLTGGCLYCAQNGFDGFALCSDYAFNANPFFSPAQFARFVTPYLERLVRTYRAMGKYVIKHSDGQLMPILDQIVGCRPHAIHSIDPQGGMDIAEVKRRFGKQVALCGNVHCGMLQTGTDAEVLASCEYAMTHGKPGGGYVYCTSNCVFKGMPLERYELMNDFWRKNRNY